MLALQFRAQRIGLAAQQLAELVGALGDLKLECRQLGARDVGLGRRVAHIDMRGQARRQPLTSQIQQLIDGREILLGNAQARLSAAKLHVALRDVGEHGHHHGPMVLNRDLLGGIRRLDGAANASEQIDFPGGAGTQLKLIVRIGNAHGLRRPASGCCRPS